MFQAIISVCNLINMECLLLRDNVGLINTHKECTVRAENMRKDFIDLYKRDDNLIGGCQSKIWVTVMKDKNNKVAVDYDSDAMITKGITHIICSCFNGMSISAAKKVKRDDFEVLGIAQLLTQQRRNGLGNLIDTIIMKVKKL